MISRIVVVSLCLTGLAVGALLCTPSAAAQTTLGTVTPLGPLTGGCASGRNFYSDVNMVCY